MRLKLPFNTSSDESSHGVVVAGESSLLDRMVTALDAPVLGDTGNDVACETGASRCRARSSSGPREAIGTTVVKDITIERWVGHQ
jgi:hypothetical protein